MAKENQKLLVGTREEAAPIGQVADALMDVMEAAQE